MGRNVSKTLIFSMNMSKFAQILETSYKQANTIQDYNTGTGFKFYWKSFYFMAKMDVYPDKGYCRLVGSAAILS